jgi:uncharacterized protein YlzI (FlbEa/FlbD family)
MSNGFDSLVRVMNGISGILKEKVDQDSQKLTLFQKAVDSINKTVEMKP